MRTVIRYEAGRAVPLHSCVFCPRMFTSLAGRSHHETSRHRDLSVPTAILRERFIERLWANVTKTPTCWTLSQKGYGAIKGNGVREGAHRLSYEIAYGPIPTGMHVLHHCDNPPCVRPDHLFLGTRADNMADMKAKGRGANPAARLTPAAVGTIRASSDSATALAIRFGVAARTIRAVRQGTSWKSVA